MTTRKGFQNLASRLINKTFGDFSDPVVLFLIGDFNDTTETYQILDTNNTIGIRIEYQKDEFDGESIEIGDYKILIEQQSVSIDIRSDNVEMTFNGNAVKIKGVSEDAARAVYTIQARDK